MFKGWKTYALVLLLPTLALGAVGCGEQSFSGGFGTLTITSVAPNPVPGSTPTPITITGSDFSNEIGTEVDVTFIASMGTPFLGGTTNEITVPGTITSSTTVETVSPVICGTLSVDVSIKITMPSGAYGMSTTTILTIAVPTLTSISGGGVFPAAIPTAFTITGTGFGPIGSTVDIRWRTTPAGGGASIFEGGASMEVTTQGTVASATTITGVSPEAVVCGVGITSVAAEIYQVDFDVGLCTLSAITPLTVSFTAPTATSILNTSGAAPDTGTNQFPAALPQPFEITGTGFGPVGGTATVTFTSSAPNAIFNGATTTSTSVVGTITSATTITGVAPEATVCIAATASDTTDVQVQLSQGSCTPATIPALFMAPTIATVLNTSGAAPHTGLAQFAGAVPEAFTVTGTRFGPVGGTALVTFTSQTASTIFEGATVATTTVVGTITSTTTIEGVSPEAAVCGVASDISDTQVTLSGGSCAPATVPVTFFAPTLTAIANTSARGGAVFLAAIPEEFTITGTDFGPVGGTALVTFTSTSVGTAATPFGGSATVTVLATITSRTTLVGTSPEATLCPVPGTDAQTGINADVDLTATLEGGACSDVTPLSVAGLMVGPTITSFASPATATPGATPVDVPSTLVLGADEAPDFRIVGTGFAPLGGIALVTFTDTVGTGFNGSATVTVPAMIIDENTVEGTLPTITTPRLTDDLSSRVTVTLAPNASCAFFDDMTNFVAPPTITTIVNTSAGAGTGWMATLPTDDFLACSNNTMTITGTGFDDTAPTTTVAIFDTGSGVDPVTQAPNRVLGTATPAGDDLGDATVFAITTTSIAGRIRADAALADLDTNADGNVPVTVRLQNADGQFHEGAVNDYLLTSPTINLGIDGGRSRNNNSIALDTSSFTDDFGTAPGAGNDTTTAGFNVVVCSANDTGGLGPVFSSTDIFFSVSLDGGQTFTSSILGAGTTDGSPAGAFRNYAQVEYDAFGNLALCYQIDDFAAGSSSIRTVFSANNGTTWPSSVTIGTASGAAVLGEPVIASGPNGTGGEKFAIAYTDRSTDAFAGDVVRCFECSFTALSAGPAVFFPVDVSQTVVPPPFGIIDAEVAVGPGGETYVAWQEPDFGAFPFTYSIRFDADRDGLSGGSFTFGPDVVVGSEDIPGFLLPSAPDTGPFVPALAMCVARAGTNSGRVLLAYENVVPSDGVTTFVDHTQVRTRYSDDNGATWSGTSYPHPIDNADRFIPAVCSDPTNGRFYITWYDTIGSIGAGNTTFERYGSASANGVDWGTVRNLSGGRAGAHTANLETDFGTYAGVHAFRGCVVATWGDTDDSPGRANPVIVNYQQNDD